MYCFVKDVIQVGIGYVNTSVPNIVGIGDELVSLCRVGGVTTTMSNNDWDFELSDNGSFRL